MNRKAWTHGPVSAPLAQMIPAVPGSGCGVPMGGISLAWRDPVLVQISDSQHPWHGRDRLHVLGATSSGRQHWAALMSLSLPDLSLAPQQTPDGEPWSWLPLPGGHEKFALVHDEPSQMHWLLGSRGGAG